MNPLRMTLCALALWALAGCGGQKSNGADAPGVNAAITITPGPARVTVGGTLAFSAQLSLGGGFRWTVVPAGLGTFSADGVFTSTAPGTGVVVATWDRDTRYVGTTPLQTLPVPDSTITSPAVADVAAPALTASVPDQPGSSYAWTLQGGTITAGEGTRQITFVPLAPGQIVVSCTVTNALQVSTDHTWPIQVVAAPAITRFTGLPVLVRPGASTALYASFRGTRGVVEPGHLPITDGGSIPVSPLQTTDFTLTVFNEAGASVTAQATVLVGDPCPPQDPAPGTLWLDPATGLQMVYCPPGTFSMGASADDADAQDNERPAHAVAFAQGFWLSRTKVTQAQWQAIMGDNPSFFQDGAACSRFGASPTRPVEQVSWQDAQEYLGRLNDRLGWSLYRLPSEAEWEYACRAGTTTRFPWGDEASGAQAAPLAWFDANAALVAWPVATLTPNAWNLSDMAGDAMEWVADSYQPEYLGAPAGGQAVLGLATPSRTLRGSSWNDGLRHLRSSARFTRVQTERLRTVGFRVARPLCAAPVIWDLQASPASLPAGGGKVTLTWRVDGADRVRFDQGLGDVTAIRTLTVQVSASTGFALAAENSGGWAMATVNVEVAR
ncbi:SUMF1/EgtB/PvdO family nonheme iron enzyme [Mesoterricola silvestris]|uniref:Sulfatase-modifying factor enzyme-like domain-containing protein n=1 Tax=Mesoterricola silvestris TaxID=2927979 RepID=A0AA48KA39_9BACT|nr:SUMF1/EgtB/PvdO family nonheme iron enzyme [Mesoterricola silvestris]BDU74211.1 hypothetical protein METEAL_33850 [Mesoterricola silvestris]